MKQADCNILLFLTAALSCLMSGCMPDAANIANKKGCRLCHDIEPDSAHMFSCKACHMGHPGEWTVQKAHDDMIPHPSYPSETGKFCSPCHAERIRAVSSSAHFTLKRESETVWNSFFPGTAPPDIRQKNNLSDDVPYAMYLIRDMLRRRCLRCHVWYSGDGYSATGHGTGCAACHMKWSGGHATSHSFQKRPEDTICLACHYGNFTGWDFVGRFEQDYPSDFRPYLVQGMDMPRPWGVYWHEMTPDIHKQAGFMCVSCHTTDICSKSSEELAGKTECTICHNDDNLDLTITGHSAEERNLVDCSACHAVWVFNDYGRSLTRQDSPDWDEWRHLAVQGSIEVETEIEMNSVRNDEMWKPAVMKDKFTYSPDSGWQEKTGIWFEAFEARRWSPVILGETCDGRLHVVRPLLDIAVSWVDQHGNTLVDNLKPSDPVKCLNPDQVKSIEYPDVTSEMPPPWMWRAYVPHTTGHPDFHRTLAVKRWLEKKKKGD